MEPVEEFMRSYFRERIDLRRSWLSFSAQFRRRFFTPEYSTDHQNRENEIRSFERETPPSILSIDSANGGSALPFCPLSRMAMGAPRVVYCSSRRKEALKSGYEGNVHRPETFEAPTGS